MAASMSIACGSDDDDSPAALCEQLGQVLCQQADTCLNEDFNACLSSFVNDPPPCSEADRVADSYDQCVSEISSASCVDIQANPDQLPDSCNGVIIFD